MVLEPLRAEGGKWDLFGEIHDSYDAAELASGLIPSSSDPTPANGAPTRAPFFVAVLRRCREMNRRDLRELCGCSPSRLARSFSPWSGYRRRSRSSSSKTPGCSVRYDRCGVGDRGLRARARPAGRSLSRCASGSGADPLRGTVHPLQGGPDRRAPLDDFHLDAARHLRGHDRRGESDQRLWFVIDELDALGAIDGLKDALARLRKFGGRCVLGFQSIAQVSSDLWKGDAQTIVENCGNTLILRCSAANTEAHRNLPRAHRTARSHAYDGLELVDPNEWRTSSTATELVRIEPAIMASQIERLADLEGYLKLASVPDWCAVKLAPVSGPTPVRVRRPATVTTPAAAVKKPREVSSPAASPGRPAANARRARKDKAGAAQIPLPVPDRSSPVASSQPESPVPASGVSTVQKSPGTAQ